MNEKPRVLRPNRAQLELRPIDLESLLPEDHRARAVWEFVEGLDLSALYAEIQSVEGHAGRPAIDPAVLLALWVYATAEGVGSARALERLCEQHDAYRWICGGVGVSAHRLSDFRVQHEARLDELLTQSVARLMAEGLVKLRRVAQDGLRVRASAGAGSFRRERRLKVCLRQARAQVEALRKELEDDPAGTSRREKAARERAARERQQRVKRALEQLGREVKRRERRATTRRRDEAKGEPRVSTTDPEARVMRFADGGYRPAYNGQLATDCDSQIVVAVDVSNRGTEHGAMPSLLKQIEAKYGRRPDAMLGDGGYAGREDVRQVEARGTRVYAPPMQPRGGGRSPYRPLPGDDPLIARWRRRMGRATAQALYRLRASSSECVNAQARNRGLGQFRVRGERRVRCVLLLHALAQNCVRGVSLREAPV